MSLEDAVAKNRLVGQMALPSDEILFEHPRIEKVHSILRNYFKNMSEQEKQNNCRNVIYTSVVDAGSKHAYPERFVYHADCLSSGDIDREISLLKSMGLSSQTIQCVKNIITYKDNTLFRFSIAERAGKFRESVYGLLKTIDVSSKNLKINDISMLKMRVLQDIQPFEILVGWGFDFENDSMAGVKFYTYIETKHLQNFQNILAKQWNINIPKQMWKLSQYYSLGRRYSLEGELTTIKPSLVNFNVSSTPAAQIAKILEPILKNISNDSFNIPWERISMRSLGFDYSPSGIFEKCGAYYYFPHTAL